MKYTYIDIHKLFTDTHPHTYTRAVHTSRPTYTRSVHTHTPPPHTPPHTYTRGVYPPPPLHVYLSLYVCIYNIRIYSLPSQDDGETPPPVGGDKQPHPAPPHSPRRFRGERHGARGTGRSRCARQGAELQAEANQNHERREHGAELACGKRGPRGVLVGGDRRG